MDFVKSDSCGAVGSIGGAVAEYKLMTAGLNATGRPIFFSLCGWKYWHAPVAEGADAPRTAPHLPVECLQGLRAHLRSPERRPSSLEARRGPRSSPQAATNSRIFFSTTRYAKLARPLGNAARIGGDDLSWAHVLNNLDTMAPLAQYAGPGYWNDPDMLGSVKHDGRLQQTELQSRMQFRRATPTPRPRRAMYP